MPKLILNELDLLTTGYHAGVGYYLKILSISTSGAFTSDGTLLGFSYGPHSYFSLYFLFFTIEWDFTQQKKQEYIFNEETE